MTPIQQLLVKLHDVADLSDDLDEVYKGLTEQEQEEVRHAVCFRPKDPTTSVPGHYLWMDGGVKLVIWPCPPLSTGQNKYAIGGVLVTNGKLGGLAYKEGDMEPCTILEAYRNKSACVLEALGALPQHKAHNQGWTMSTYLQELAGQ